MKTTVKRIILILLIAAVLVIAFLWYRGGWNSALSSRGLKPAEMTELYFERDSSGTEIRILTNYGKNEKPVLVKMIREKGRFFKAMDSGNSVMAEAESAFGKSYLPQDPLSVESEYHLFYCGNDATTVIRSLDDFLPGGVTAQICQQGNCYLIHFMSFGDSNKLTALDLADLLRQGGYIAQK